MADYQQGSGPDALAKGDATQANQDLAQGRAAADQIAANDPVQQAQQAQAQPNATPDAGPVQYATGPDPTYTPQNPMDQVLFGPSDGNIKPLPDPSQDPIPQHIIRSLPSMAAIVQDPTTPPAIRAAYEFIVQRIASDMERNIP